KRAYCLKTQPATGETYPKSDLFNKATLYFNIFNPEEKQKKQKPLQHWILSPPSSHLMFSTWRNAKNPLNINTLKKNIFSASYLYF
ncbi:hypothetical protein, partial [Escherichia coli]|uniref:hypothetical protein n=1 Tax=Escherichia coli TaxID=562 RepID=UPI002252E5B1